MRIGDVSRPRRFANPARLRWYAFHRSVRFALRMMKADETPCQSDLPQLQLLDVPADLIQGQEIPGPVTNPERTELEL